MALSEIYSPHAISVLCPLALVLLHRPKASDPSAVLKDTLNYYWKGFLHRAALIYLQVTELDVSFSEKSGQIP